MTRLALGAKCGRPEGPFDLSVSSASALKRAGFKSEPRAAAPMPVAMRPKKCRRVSNSFCSWSGSIEKAQRLKGKAQDDFQIHPFVTVSSRFKIMLAMVVHAANSLGSRFCGAL